MAPLIHMQKFGTHDVVVLKPNKADLGSPSLGQGVVYRLKALFQGSKCIPAGDHLQLPPTIQSVESERKG